MNEKKSLNNTDKNQKRKKSYKTLIGDLTQYTRDCLFPGESPVFLPPHPCGSRSNSPKKNKKRKEKKRARFTWCSSVCIALAV